MNIPTKNDVIKDVEMRLALLGRLLDFDENLSNDEWGKLIYYKELHTNNRTEFKQILNGIRQGSKKNSAINTLSPHARWLAAVYTAQELTSPWCFGGSRYHRRVLNLLGSTYDPRRILAQIPGLPKAIESLKARLPQANPKLIENIAIDETFELLGRSMSI